jgi:hypothetical protein
LLARTLQVTDNSPKREPPDLKHIRLSQPREVAYWTKTLGVTEAQLTNAVRRVGNRAEKVHQYLAKK